VHLLLGVGNLGLNIASNDTHKALDTWVQRYKGGILSGGFARAWL
jgi:hypothetical protein